MPTAKETHLSYLYKALHLSDTLGKQVEIHCETLFLEKHFIVHVCGGQLTEVGALLSKGQTQVFRCGGKFPNLLGCLASSCFNLELGWQQPKNLPVKFSWHKWDYLVGSFHAILHFLGFQWVALTLETEILFLEIGFFYISSLSTKESLPSCAWILAPSGWFLVLGWRLFPF